MTGSLRDIANDQAAANTPMPMIGPPMPGSPAIVSPATRTAMTDGSRDGSATKPSRRTPHHGQAGQVRIVRRVVTPRRLLALVAACAACWTGGFVWFLGVTSRPAQSPPYADGIVALTGGAGRVELALRMLANGQASRLLLSGIGGGTELVTLGRLAGVDTSGLTERVTLGRYAASTRGNGVETAAWVEQNRIKSLIVVTAGYHMLRALAELRRAAPDVRLYPLPVDPTAMHPGDDGYRPGLRLKAVEYTKYLLTVSGLSTWLPRREPMPTPALPSGAGAKAGARAGAGR